MPKQSGREQLIRRSWLEIGSKQWQPDVHGRGLASLNIQAQNGMVARRMGEPIPPFDNLEFTIRRSEIDGEHINEIVCEGFVVELPGAK